jgi:hypothetical protein
MAKLGGAIVETLVQEFGKSEVLRRLSDPLWFQAFGCVLGMDWHSSGITTSVMGALKRAVNPMAAELGIYICGGRGKYSRQTPQELLKIADKTGINGDALVRSSKLAAKVDNTAVQDGFQLYLHNFIVTNEGEWAIVQQGMNGNSGMARRYHWHSAQFKSYMNAPHVGVTGENMGFILNLADTNAGLTRKNIIDLTRESPDKILQAVRRIIMPRHHEVTVRDVNMKRLGAVLTVAHERDVLDFETLLLLEGAGPRTIQSLALVSEVIYGSPIRFNDPARFSFAHGGKDGHPFPVALKVYDESIQVLKSAVGKARIGSGEKQNAIQKLSAMAWKVEEHFEAKPFFDQLLTKEKNESHLHGGTTVLGKDKPSIKKQGPQLDLF